MTISSLDSVFLLVVSRIVTQSSIACLVIIVHLGFVLTKYFDFKFKFDNCEFNRDNSQNLL